jgi:hypothetical protein
MDTEWFALDAKGQVGVFDTGEDGALPDEAYSDPEKPVLGFIAVSRMAQLGEPKWRTRAGGVEGYDVQLIVSDGKGFVQAATQAGLTAISDRFYASRSGVDAEELEAWLKDGSIDGFLTRDELLAWLGAAEFRYDEGPATGGYERRRAPKKTKRMSRALEKTLGAVKLPVDFSRTPKLELWRYLGEDEVTAWDPELPFSGDEGEEDDDAGPRPTLFVFRGTVARVKARLTEPLVTAAAELTGVEVSLWQQGKLCVLGVELGPSARLSVLAPALAKELATPVWVIDHPLTAGSNPNVSAFSKSGQERWDLEGGRSDKAVRKFRKESGWPARRAVEAPKGKVTRLALTPSEAFQRALDERRRAEREEEKARAERAARSEAELRAECWTALETLGTPPPPPSGSKVKGKPERMTAGRSTVQVMASAGGIACAAGAFGVSLLSGKTSRQVLSGSRDVLWMSERGIIAGGQLSTDLGASWRPVGWSPGYSVLHHSDGSWWFNMTRVTAEGDLEVEGYRWTIRSAVSVGDDILLVGPDPMLWRGGKLIKVQGIPGDEMPGGAVVFGSGVILMFSEKATWRSIDAGASFVKTTLPGARGAVRVGAGAVMVGGTFDNSVRWCGADGKTSTQLYKAETEATAVTACGDQLWVGCWNGSVLRFTLE